MPPWVTKALAQGVMSALPQPQRWNGVFQRHVTKSLAITDEYFLRKWRHGEEHLAAHRTHTGRQGGFVALELGTGWYPVVPIGLILGGAARVWSVDAADHISHGRVVRTLLLARDVADRSGRERIDALVEKADDYDARGLLRQLGIVTVVGDARALELPDASVDLLVSNNTLEHIPRDVIAGILAEFRRVARPDAVMSHFVDLADHYAGFDRSITAYNFLKFSDRTWRLFNNELHYQNRLRIPDYRRLHADAGWRIVDEQTTSGHVEQLRSVRVAPEFSGYTEEELLVCKALLTSRPGPAAT